MQQEAIQKITESGHGNHGADLANPIIKFITSKCEEDDEFAALVMLEHKTLEKCLDFVMEQAKKHLDGKSGCIPPDEVYLMTMDYFRLDDEALERKAAEEEEKRRKEREKREAESKRKADEAKAKKEAEAKQKTASSKVIDGQMSLFD